MADRKTDAKTPLDVLVAGAGYVGLAAAVSLKQARPGLAVAVVDAAPAGVWQKDGRAIFDRDIQAASLDHAMWFHRSHPLDDWILYTQDSPSTQGSRGFTRGSLFARDGTLIASVAQEGLIRLKRPPAE